MSSSRAETHFFDTIDAFERSFCLLLNHACHRQLIKSWFVCISRLGNGVFWYVLIGAIPVIYGPAAAFHAAHLLLVGLVNVGLYKVLKTRLGRHRPFVSHQEIQAWTAPLDWYSFPSGHSLHAAAFTILAMVYHPLLGFICIPFSVMVGLSRVVLGLHYPSDVLAGIALGTTTACASFLLF